MEPAIRLYAELLLNIRSVTLSGSVRSYTASESVARLSSDGTHITVSHEGKKAAISLPARAIGTASADITIPAGDPKEISSRLQVDGDLSDLVTLRGDDVSNIVPWCASTMSPNNSLCCQTCGQNVVHRSKIQAWKDLPSANWAEMMDFWHCHKPHVDDDPEGKDDAAAKKGYAAGSRVKAVPGSGLIDLSSFLLSSRDCDSIQIAEHDSRSQSSPPSCLQCQFCRTTLGVVDDLATGWRLYKWRIAIFDADQTAFVSYSKEKWHASQLLAVAENNGVRKFFIRAAADGDKSALIWLFAPDLYFCSSTSNIEGASKAVRASKVLWQQISSDECDKLQNASSVEELDMRNELNAELLDTLRTNQDLLPESMRTYQGWHVSLLSRFSPDDVDGDAKHSKWAPLLE